MWCGTVPERDDDAGVSWSEFRVRARVMVNCVRANFDLKTKELSGKGKQKHV